MRKTPLRKCLGCGELKEKKALIRVVKTNEDAFFIDETGKKNGRGAYVCNSRNCLELAIKSKGLERSFKTAIPDAIYDALREGMDAIEKS